MRPTASASTSRPTLRGCWKWSTVVAEKRTSLTDHWPLTTDHSCSVLHRQARRTPGLHAAFQIEDVLHAQRRGHLGGHRAALANFTDEDHVVRLDHVLRSGDDLPKRRQRGAGYVIASVFPVLTDVDDLQLASRHAFVGFLRTEPAEGLGLVLGHGVLPRVPETARIPMRGRRRPDRYHLTARWR